MTTVEELEADAVDAAVARAQVAQRRWAGLEQRFLISPTKDVRITVGGEGQRHFVASLRGEDANGTYLDASRPYTVLAGYAVADATLHPRLKISAGGRYDYIGSTSAGSLNPRGAIIVRPWEAGTLKLMGGKAFRSPS